MYLGLTWFKQKIERKLNCKNKLCTTQITFFKCRPSRRSFVFALLLVLKLNCNKKALLIISSFHLFHSCILYITAEIELKMKKKGKLKFKYFRKRM